MYEHYRAGICAELEARTAIAMRDDTRARRAWERAAEAYRRAGMSAAAAFATRMWAALDASPRHQGIPDV